MRPRFTALVVLDGFGCAGATGPAHNAIARAATPTFDALFRDHAWALVGASGLDVGLPDGQMGNSEVGHLNMGSGRVVYQDSVRITKEIREGQFFANETLARALAGVRERGGSAHFVGLLSHGGVHSLQRHLEALLDMAERAGVPSFVHAVLDGRDTPPMSGDANLEEICARLATLSQARLATVVGRYYAMDRDQRWERTQRAYDLMTTGLGSPARDAVAAVRASHERGVGDEFVEPIAMVDLDGNHFGKVQDGDLVVFFNFRADRARQLTRAFTTPDFASFPRALAPRVDFVTMTEYGNDFDVRVAFPPERFENILAAVWQQAGVRNLRLSETEKYAHVTFFFNGGEHAQFGSEERILIPSPKVATYDLAPAMSAFEITDRALAEIGTGNWDALVMNYANADMVGHTGFLEATERAIAVLDACLARLIPAILARGGAAIITADHGNAEKMFDEASGQPHTAHTLNPVPMILVDASYTGGLRPGGILADIAPTMLGIMGLSTPPQMTGRDLRDAAAPRRPDGACNAVTPAHSTLGTALSNGVPEPAGPKPAESRSLSPSPAQSQF